MKTRAHGSGGLYFVSSQNLWRAVVDLGRDDTGKRRQWTSSSRDREAVERRLTAKLRELGRKPVDPHALRPARSRIERLRAAGPRATRAEIRNLRRDAPKKCPYCGVRMDAFNSVIDHMVAVARGGSDAIENLQVICWECNAEKLDMNADEYQYIYLRPRAYRPHPARVASYERDCELRGIA